MKLYMMQVNRTVYIYIYVQYILLMFSVTLAWSVCTVSCCNCQLSSEIHDLCTMRVLVWTEYIPRALCVQTSWDTHNTKLSSQQHVLLHKRVQALPDRQWLRVRQSWALVLVWLGAAPWHRQPLLHMWAQYLKKAMENGIIYIIVHTYCITYTLPQFPLIINLSHAEC